VWAASSPSATWNAQIQDGFHFHRLAADAMFQRSAIQILHHDEGAVVFLADFVDRTDVRMIQRRCSLCFPVEPFQRLRIQGNVIWEELERHEAVQASVLCLIHNAHATATEFLDDAIVRDGSAD
jgi:hypothetical protein